MSISCHLISRIFQSNHYPLLDLYQQSIFTAVLSLLANILVIPLVIFPFESIQISKNSTFGSPATGWNAEGVLSRSTFKLRKSSFKTSICDSIYALAIFRPMPTGSPRCRTSTTTGMIIVSLGCIKLALFEPFLTEVI
jgi:hypothetical protein